MATSEPEQPNLSEAEAHDVHHLHGALNFLAGYLRTERGGTTWKAEDGNGHAISDMFRLLRVEPLAVALVLSEMLNGMIDAGDEPNPLSYGAGFTAGLATGIYFEVARAEREREESGA